MHKIIEKRKLSDTVYLMKLMAPHIARERKAGQFVIVQLDSNFSERIPLTIADANREEGWITIIFQLVGSTTRKMAVLEVGDCIGNVLGPLGQPTHIENFGKVACVGGGIGVAPMYPIVQALKQAGNHVTVIMGARNRELLILEEEMRAVADDVILCTDDGSAGRKALVTEPLKELCETGELAFSVAIGPPIMMKFAVETVKPYNVPMQVSLNTIMIDGTGMCGGCRVTVGDEIKFVCVDGPEFDGYLVDFDTMMKRLNTFKIQETESDHRCKIGRA